MRRSSTKAPAFGVLQGLGQQVVQLEHLDAALLHLEHEIVVILLCFVDPDHIVEQQIVAIAGRQALMGERWPADHDGPQLADLRMNADLLMVHPRAFPHYLGSLFLLFPAVLIAAAQQFSGSARTPHVSLSLEARERI